MTNATVAIIGGGFSGTVAAIRLLSSPQRNGPSLPFGSKIVLIEPGRAGEGLAYRAGPDYWRLNVPAERMSAFPERPNDFLDFARARNPLVSGGDFLPRSWYGDYLSDRLELARRRSPRWLSFERVRARATAIGTRQGILVTLVIFVWSGCHYLLGAIGLAKLLREKQRERGD